MNGLAPPTFFHPLLTAHSIIGCKHPSIHHALSYSPPLSPNYKFRIISLFVLNLMFIVYRYK
jgi:hypothetical protein